MKSYSVVEGGTLRYNVNGVEQGGSYPMLATKRYNYFTFSGFGAGSPPLATPGTFVKRDKGYMTGSRVMYYKSAPKVLYKHEGVIEGPLQAICVYPVQQTTDTYLWNKALDNLYSKRDDWLSRTDEELSWQSPRSSNWAVTVGEGRETRRMVEQMWASTRNAVDTLIRWKRRPIDTISGMWLMWTYGIRPAINDIYNLVDHVGSSWGSRSMTGTATYGKKPYYEKQTRSGTNPGYSIEGWRQLRCRIEATFHPYDVLAYDRSRWTSYNPIVIGWELVPLSFVFDWVYDVGSFLRNMEAAQGRGLVFEHGCVTWTYMHQLAGYATHSYQDTSTHTTWDIGGWDVLKYKERSRLTYWPRPKLPTVNVHFGWRRMMSAWALAWQRMPRDVRAAAQSRRKWREFTRQYTE